MNFKIQWLFIAMLTIGAAGDALAQGKQRPWMKDALSRKDSPADRNDGPADGNDAPAPEKFNKEAEEEFQEETAAAEDDEESAKEDPGDDRKAKDEDREKRAVHPAGLSDPDKTAGHGPEVMRMRLGIQSKARPGGSKKPKATVRKGAPKGKPRKPAPSGKRGAAQAVSGN